MAQPRAAPTPRAQTLQITITYTNGQWKANPPNPPQAQVDNGGQVTFNCSGACWVYTDPTDAFTTETNGYLKLNQGNNSAVTPKYSNRVIKYCITDPNALPCTPTGPAADSGYSIDVGTPPEPGSH